MYSDKANINILTTLLIAHGVRNAVVCPGSRNAPITHNLCECHGINCLSVTDERSAGFVALGMALSLNEPVAVCVTSGSALLNTLPAVAEAFYQHVPIVIISADRPAAMIDQLQGQTLPQDGAFGKLVRKAVALPEPHDATERWHCNRLVNEALISTRQHGGGPVHINVPITEPLFNFTSPSLPEERIVRLTQATPCKHAIDSIACDFAMAERTMLVIGQLPRLATSDDMGRKLTMLGERTVILHEQLSRDGCQPCHFDDASATIGNDADLQPDFVIYLGGNIVSKRIKQYLQSFDPRRTVIANDTGELTDVTMHTTDLVECSACHMVNAIAKAFSETGQHGSTPTGERHHGNAAYVAKWNGILAKCKKHCDDFQPQYSQMLAVKKFHDITNKQQCRLHYANSSAVRLGQLYSTHYLYVNRGVNGIEGSLSVAVGFAATTNLPTYCVIGDLSFFYDQNALWNNLPKNNLRILLLNNNGGGIFHQLPNIGTTPHLDTHVAATHHTTANGICNENHVDYRQANNQEELEACLQWLTDDATQGPRLLEVFTDMQKDASELSRYHEEAKAVLP